MPDLDALFARARTEVLTEADVVMLDWIGELLEQAVALLAKARKP